jgi:hypothetical protein
LKSESTIKRNKKHGLYYHPLYAVWNTMKSRCRCPTNNKYDYYGGRGIALCDEWNNPEPFIEWALANGWERGLQIDREDNNGNYEPGNCRFVTSKVNSNNRRPYGSQMKKVHG